MLIDGIHIPLTLPFNRNGDLYLHKLNYNVGRYSLTPATAFVVLTADNEADTLSDIEVADVLQAVSASAAPEKVLIAAVSKTSVRGALAIAGLAYTSNFDALLLSPPLQAARLSPNELLLFFRTVADRSLLPVLLGSFVREYQLSIDQIHELAWHPNIIGLYDDGLTADRYHAIAAATQGLTRSITVTQVFAPVTRRMSAAGEPNAASSSSFITAESLVGGTARVNAATPPAQRTALLKTRTKSLGFQVMAAGSALHLTELLHAGVAGAMLALSACTPQACHEAYAAFKDGDPALAAEKGQRLLPADAALARAGIAGTKYGCDLNGYYGGAPRLPRLPLDATSRANMERILAGLQN